MKLTRAAVLAGLVVTSFAAQGLAQAARFTTPPGGDASGNYVTVEATAREGALRGDRTVERIDAHGGYTTGSLTEVVVSGAEPEALRTLRVHLPYGVSLDLARGDRVHAEISARRRGLGAVYEVLLTRGNDVVLLATASDRTGGFTVTRGVEASNNGSHRTFALSVTYAGQTTSVGSRDLAYLAPGLLAGGVDSIYEGHRPPDAFDQRLLTAARVRPIATR